MRQDTAEFFRGVVAQLDQYPSIRQCAAANDLPEATLRYWINKFNKENHFNKKLMKMVGMMHIVGLMNFII